MREFDLYGSIVPEFVDEDAERWPHPPDDPARFMREFLGNARPFEPMDKPCECSRRDWRRNARRDFILRRAFVLLALAYGMNQSKASVVIANECEAIVRAMGKRGHLHPSLISGPGHVRDLWVKRSPKAAWDARARLVEDRATVFAVLAGLEANDLAIQELRKKGALF